MTSLRFFIIFVIKREKNMGQEQENLDMSFFENDDLELNLDYNPEEDHEKEEEDSSEENINNIPSEDQEDSEKVTGDEDQDQEGDDSEKSSDEDSPNDSNDLYSSFASVLADQGLLPSLDLDNNKINSIEDLTDSIKNEISAQSKQYLYDKIGEEGYQALEKGVSLSEYQQYQNTVSTLDNINDEALEGDLELAKQLIKQDYLSQGMSEDRVNKLLKKSIDLGEDMILEDAKDSLESLRVIQGKKMEALAAERENEKQEEIRYQEKIDNDLKNSIYNKEEFIKGIKANKAIKDQVYNSITKIVGQGPNGVAENKLMQSRREDPIEFDSKLYYVFELTNGFTDFSKLVSKSESKALSKLEQNLRKQKYEDSGKPSYMEDPDSYGGLGDEIIL